jgi:hypothetical protein
LRIAITIISLLLMVVVAFQSCAASVGGSLGNDRATSAAAAGIGLIVALLFFTFTYLFGTKRSQEEFVKLNKALLTCLCERERVVFVTVRGVTFVTKATGPAEAFNR